MMRVLARLGVVCFLLTACVTINVYFPAAAAEEAADKIINEVQGEGNGVSDASGDQSAIPDPADGPLLAFAGAILDVLIPPAHAQSRPDIDISTPAIRAVVASTKRRFPQLKPFYDSGAIGLTNTGTIELRDRKLIALPDRNKVNKLIADENKDRNALYREIASANGHPEWETDIRRTFAQRWISKARPGWHYRNSAGQWARK